MSRRPQVVFDGWYGRRNAGDDAFCVVAAEVARRQWGMGRVAFVGPHRALPALPRGARGVYPDPPKFRGHGRLGPVPAMLAARKVVHVGGSTFTHRITRQRDETRLARAGLISLHAVGVSIGPFARERDGEQVADVLRHFATVSVRDSASAQRAARLELPVEVRLGFDVAVLLPTLRGMPSAGAEPGGRRPLLGLSLCDDTSSTGDPERVERRQRRTRSLVADVVRRAGAAVRILVFNDHPGSGDVALSHDLARDLDTWTDVEVVTRSADVGHLLSAVASCDAVLATRLHSAVFAYACEVPFAVVAYQQKCADFAAEVGLPEELRWPADGPALETDGATVAQLLGDPPPGLRPCLPVSEARERAHRAFPERP